MLMDVPVVVVLMMIMMMEQENSLERPSAEELKDKNFKPRQM